MQAKRRGKNTRNKVAPPSVNALFRGGAGKVAVGSGEVAADEDALEEDEFIKFVLINFIGPRRSHVNDTEN